MKKMILLLLTITFFFTGCGKYSSNFAPDDLDPVINTDPCFDDDKAVQIVKIVNVAATGNNVIAIDVVIKGPCSGTEQPSFSLAFYDVSNFSQPSDLNHLTFTWPANSGMNLITSNCQTGKVHPTIDDMESAPEFTNLQKSAEGSAISLSLGMHNKNILYPFAVKLNYKSEGALGSGKNCDNVNFDPFIVDETTWSPIEVNGKYKGSKNGELGSYNMYNHNIIGMGAPFYTYNVLSTDDEDEGIQSLPNQTSQGSYYQFHVHLKKGTYYVVLSHVIDPMGATTGDFSLDQVSIFGKRQKTLDYATECNKDVSCEGNAAKIHVY